VQLLNDEVLLRFEAHGGRIEAVLSDRRPPEPTYRSGIVRRIPSLYNQDSRIRPLLW